ncbi:MAG: ATP-binding protein [Erysipelotrichaceae bacterium]|nr:ATP-binding protein [Erysipelotrichaceae bacterium]
MSQKELILNDEHLSIVAKSDPFVDDHIGSYMRVLKSRKLCDNCPGLYECRQPSKGERLDLVYDGVLIEEIEYCDYALDQKKKESVLSKYLYCDVPKELSDLDLESVSYTKEQKSLYLELAKILHEKSEKGLYICGDLGVGKTYLCTALANSLVKQGKKVAFVKVTNFFNQMKSDFSENPENVGVKISLLKKADYLFLDDIGAETVSEFVRDDVLFRILDYRLENKKITIFTSNLNKEDLLKHYQYDRREKSNLMNARRLMERIDILSDNFILSGINMRRR